MLVLAAVEVAFLCPNGLAGDEAAVPLLAARLDIRGNDRLDIRGNDRQGGLVLHSCSDVIKSSNCLDIKLFVLQSIARC